MADSLERKICKEISKELSVSYEQVYSIVNGSTDYVKHVMENSGFESVMMPYFGKFLVKPNRLKYYNDDRIKRKAAKANEAIYRRKSADINKP
jgi:nucleoid DNA-binding protein